MSDVATPSAPVSEAPQAEVVNEIPDKVENTEVKSELEANGKETPKAKEGGEKFVLKNIKTGKVEEVDIKRMHMLAQKAWAADQKFDEAETVAQKREEQIVLALREAANSNPIELLKQLNPNFNEDEYLQNALIKKLEWESLSEEQRNAIKDKQELEQYKKEKEMTEKQRQEQETVERRTKWVNDFNREIIDNLEKSGVLKNKAMAQRGPEVARRIANYKYLALKQGQELPTDKALQLVMEDYRNEVNGFYRDVDDNKLSEVADQELINKFAKATVNSNKAKGVFPNGKTPIPTGMSKKRDQKMTESQFREYLDNLV